MRRPRNVYYFRAIICFVLGVALMIVIPVFFSDFFKEVGTTIGFGILLGALSIIVGLINYGIARNDANREKENYKRIAELEKKVKELKGDKLEDYKMRDFD